MLNNIRITFTLFAALGLTLQASAQQPVDEKRVREIGYMLRCPICQGLAVSESHSEISENMKDKIRELIAEGKSDDEIYQYFEERYGEWILRSPRKVGWNILLWIVPGVLLGGTLGGLIWYLRRKGKELANESVEPISELPPEEEELIAEEMANVEKNY